MVINASLFTPIRINTYIPRNETQAGPSSANSDGPPHAALPAFSGMFNITIVGGGDSRGGIRTPYTSEALEWLA